MTVFQNGYIFFFWRSLSIDENIGLEEVWKGLRVVLVERLIMCCTLEVF